MRKRKPREENATKMSFALHMHQEEIILRPWAYSQESSDATAVDLGNSFFLWALPQNPFIWPRNMSHNITIGWLVTSDSRLNSVSKKAAKRSQQIFSKWTRGQSSDSLFICLALCFCPYFYTHVRLPASTLLPEFLATGRKRKMPLRGSRSWTLAPLSLANNLYIMVECQKISVSEYGLWLSINDWESLRLTFWFPLEGGMTTPQYGYILRGQTPHAQVA